MKKSNEQFGDAPNKQNTLFSIRLTRAYQNFFNNAIFQGLLVNNLRCDQSPFLSVERSAFTHISRLRSKLVNQYFCSLQFESINNKIALFNFLLPTYL